MLALLLPVDGQVLHPFQASSDELWRLTPVKNRFDNVGCEESEWQDKTDVARVSPAPPSKFVQADVGPGPDVVKPAMRPDHELDEFLIGLGRNGNAFDNEPCLDSAVPEGDRDVDGDIFI